MTVSIPKPLSVRRVRLTRWQRYLRGKKFYDRVFDYETRLHRPFKSLPKADQRFWMPPALEEIQS